MLGLNEFISSRWPEIITFLMVLARTGGLVISAPFWGVKVVPSLVKVIVAVSLSVGVYPLVQIASLTANEGSGGPSLLFVVMALGGEILLGLALGWGAQILFAGISLGARQMELKMGFAMARLVNPQSGEQTGIIGVILDLFTALVFFSVNGHLLLIRALSSSYSVFPLAGDKAEVIPSLVASAGVIFTIAVRVSAPIVVGLLLSNLILGMVSRAVPQMNVFLVAMPLQITFGMILFILSLPVLTSFIINQLSAIDFELLSIMPAGGSE